jgi:hypothetical protein
MHSGPIPSARIPGVAFLRKFKTILLDTRNGCGIYVIRNLMTSLPYIRSKYSIESVEIGKSNLHY